MKLIKLWTKIGKQPIKTTQKQDVIAIVNEKRYPVTHVKYESGKMIGLVVDTSNEVK